MRPGPAWPSSHRHPPQWHHAGPPELAEAVSPTKPIDGLLRRPAPPRDLPVAGVRVFYAPSMTVFYASIGNSDDKLTQREWAEFSTAFMAAVVELAGRVHGQWWSAPDAPFQNACACFEAEPPALATLMERLTRLRATYRQDSIAWAEAPRVLFI